MNIEQNFKGAKSYLDIRTRLYFSRKRAHSIRDLVIKRKGYKVVTPSMMKSIKDYSKDRFDSSSFWPWLALYAEIREEFIEGWTPYDFYKIILQKRLNKEPATGISELKTFDHKLFPDFSLKPLLLVINGAYYSLNFEKVSIDEAKKIIIENSEEVVIKEDVSMGGSRVKFYDSKVIDLSSLDKNRNYIIQPVLKQHSVLAIINSKSVNTIRVLTYQNNDGEIEVIYSYLRFGNGNSRVDNMSAGGGSYFLSSDGKLENYAYDRLGFRIEERNNENAGLNSEAIRIPNFIKVLEKCKKAHRSYPYVRIVGWDVSIDVTGTPVLLEWNTNSMTWRPEALRGPFFKDFNDLSN